MNFIWNRWFRKKLEHKRRKLERKAEEAQRRKADAAAKLANMFQRMLALESLERWKKKVREWLAALEKSRARNAFARSQRKLTLESLEPRQLLSITVVPSLSVAADHVAAGAAVNVSTAMPNDATGSISYTVGGTPVGGTAPTLASVNTLQLSGTNSGMNTDVSLDPVQFPNLTISAWVKVNGPSGDTADASGYIGSFDGPDGGFWRGVRYITSGDESPDWSVSVGDGAWDTGIAAAVGGGWHFIALVYSSTNVDFYYDGVDHSRGSPGNWGAYNNESSNLAVGYDAFDGGDQWLNGAINEVEVWDSALNSMQIAQLDNNGIGLSSINTGSLPDTADLVAGFDLEGNTDDFTGHGHDGTLFGGASFSSDGGGFQTVATLSNTFSDAGDIPIIAAYAPSGDSIGVYAAATAYYTETVLGTTTTTLGSLPSTPDLGANVELTADVSPTSGSDTPTGVVEFYDGTTNLGTAPLNTSGTATLYTTAIPGSSVTQSIHAVYEGDASFAGSTSGNSSITVLPDVAPQLAASENTVVYGQPVDFSVSVPSSAASTATISLDDNGEALSGASDLPLSAGGSALQLDGTYGGVTTNLLMDPADYPDMTLSAWVYINGWTADTTTNMNIVGCFDSTYGGFYRSVGYTSEGSGGTWQVAVGNVSSPETSDWNTGVAAVTGGWHHVTVVYSSTNVKFYYDDDAAVSMGSAGTWGGYSSTLAIGNDTYQSSTQWVDAAIDDVCVWKSALDCTEAGDLYTVDSGLIGDYPQWYDLVAGYHFNEGAGNRAHDFTANGHDGTLFGAAGWTAGALADAEVASFSATFSTVGSHSITAVYNPATSDSFSGGVSAALPIVVIASSLSDTVANAPPNQAAPSPLADGSLVLPFAPAGLTYVSGANGNAIVSADTTLDATEGGDPEGSPLSYVTATLTLTGAGGSITSDTLYYSGAGAAADTPYRFTVPIENQYLSTGVYAYSMAITEYFENSDSADVGPLTGTKNVLNWTASPFGAGWWLDGLSQLYFDGSGNVTYMQSNGSMAYYTLGDGTFTSPAGPFAFTTLQLVSDEEGERYELTGTDGSMEVFDPSTGCLLSVTDHDGNQTTYNWSDGQLQTIVDPAGRTTTFSPNDNGTVNTITDFAGRDTTLAYVTSGAFPVLTSVTEPDPEYTGETQPVSNFAYDPVTLLMTTYVDANNNATQFGYRSNFTLATMTGADGSTVSYQSALPEMPPDLGQGQPLPGSEFNPAPLVVAATVRGVVSDQLDRPTLYTFDQFGNYTSVENALAQTTVFQRDDNGLVTEMDQPDPSTGQPFNIYGTIVGPQTFYSYTTVGMLAGEDNPDGEKQDWAYTTLSTPGGNYVVPTQTGEGFGVEVGAAPPINQIESFAWFNGDTTDTYTYSADMSTGSSAIYADTTNVEGDSFVGSITDGTVTWSYDSAPVDTDPTFEAPVNWSAISFPPDVVDYGYDSNGDATSVAQENWPGSTLTQYTYTTLASPGGSCPAGMILTETDPNGNVTSYEYNTTGAAAGLVSEVDLPSDTSVDSGSPLYTPAASVYYGYDGTTADLTSYIDANSNETDFGYDNLDREVSETDPADSNGNQPQTDLLYDAMGNVTSQQVLQAVSNYDQVWQNTTFTYNTLEQLSTVSAPGPDGSSTAAVTTYTYTPTGNIYQMKDADNGVETFGYDALGKQTSDSLPDPASGAAGGPITSYAYDALGRKTSVTTPPMADDNTSTTSYSYTFGTTDSPGVTFTTTLPDPSGGGDDYYSPVITDVYDQNGNLAGDTSPSPGATSPSDTSTTTTNYQYDALGRPLQATNPTNNELLGPLDDADGNVISDTDLENGAKTDYTYNARNELVETTGPYPDPQDAAAGVESGDADAWSSVETVTVLKPVVVDTAGDMKMEQSPAYVVENYSTTAGNTLTWTFDSLVPGEQYEIQASWAGDSEATTDASSSYTNGGSPVDLGGLDESHAPRADYTSIDGTDTTDWQGMVVFTAAGTSATFTVTSGDGDTMIPQVQIQEARAVATFGYDLAGNMTSETSPTGATTVWTYDQLNRETSMTLPDPATGENTDSVHGAVTDYGYDLVGNVVSVTSPSPTGSGYVTTTNTYDQANNLESTTDANGDVTTFSHDGVGDTLSLTDSDGNTTSWTFDHDGQQTSQSQIVALGYFPDGTVQTALATSYNFYDPAGNLTSSIDSDHRSISYAYDHVFQETGETWTDAAGDPAGGVAYSYNAAGYMTAASNGTGSSTTNIASYGFYHDISGNVTDASANLPGADDTTVQLGATYDYNGNMTSLAVNIGGEPSFHVGDFTGFTYGVNDFTNNYTYDPMGDMTSVTQTGDGITSKSVTMSYDSDQRLTGLDMYQSSGTSSLVAAAGYSYNGDSELTDLTYNTLADGTGTVLAGYHWDYNASGAVSDVFSLNDTNPTDSPDPGNNATWASATYSYDPTAQLLGASYSTSFANAPTTDSGETYDPNGNRASVAPVSPTTTTTGADNRLLYDGNFYYTYDAEGNRTAKYQISGGSDVSLGTQSSPNTNAENITIYTWDNSNQMTSATFYNTAADWSAGTITAAGEWTVTYGNDAFGRMVTRTATVTNSDLSQTTTTENFIYDGQNIALILDGDGNVIERELTGAAPDQVFASENASTNVVNWYLTDNQGTVRDVVQSDGTTTTEVDHLVYSAYGQLTDQTAAPDLGERPTFYYNGTWQDPQTGMNKMGLRWADLADAVFASQDPIGFWSGTTNLSEYVGNSPTNFTDPTGMAGKGIEADPAGAVGTEASGCGCVHRPVGTGAISEGTGLGSGIFVTRQQDEGSDGDGDGPFFDVSFTDEGVTNKGQYGNPRPSPNSPSWGDVLKDGFNGAAGWLNRLLPAAAVSSWSMEWSDPNMTSPRSCLWAYAAGAAHIATGGPVQRGEDYLTNSQRRG